MRQWIGFGVLSFVLGTAGYPWIYRTYLNITGKETMKLLSEVEALEAYKGCIAASYGPFSSKSAIERCAPFFTSYLPQKTKSIDATSPWPVPVPKEEVLKIYRSANKARVAHELTPLPPIEQLTHGHLHTVASTTDDTPELAQ